MSSHPPKINEPRSLAQATALCERFAVLEGEIGLIEQTRSAAIAAANAHADAEAGPLIAERDAIAAKLGLWWAKKGAALCDDKRKSIELGGCVIGTRMGRDSLAVEEDEKKVATILAAQDWAKPLLRFSVSLDKPAILKSLDGIYKVQLARLGLRRRPGGENFFITRTEQAGVRS